MTIFRLGDVAAFNPTVKLTRGTVAPYVGMESLAPFTRDVFSSESKPYTGGAKFLDGDILMARITPSLENGKTSIYRASEQTRSAAFGSTEFIVIRGVPGKTRTDFLYYLLTTPDIRDVAIASMTGSSGRQRVQTDVLMAHQIEVPPVAEQRAIAATLGALDDKIESNLKQVQIAEIIIDTHYEKLCAPTSANSDSGSWGELSEIGKIIGGGTPRKSVEKYFAESGIAWLTPKDLSLSPEKFRQHGITDISQEGLDNSSARLMPRGTVLFTSRAPIGYVAVATGSVSTNQGFKSVIPNSGYSSAFVYALLKANTDVIVSRAGGSTFKEISGSGMKQIPIWIPDHRILEQFDEVATPLMALQEQNEAEIRTLKNLRDILLPELMSGRIRVVEAREAVQDATDTELPEVSDV